MKKLKVLLYGEEIVWALRKDEMLKRADSEEGLFFNCTDFNNMSREEAGVWYDIQYLFDRGYIYLNADGGYSITSAGRDFLSRGGFETEAERSKNDIYAFRISVVAIVFSLVSLLVAILDLCIRR